LLFGGFLVYFDGRKNWVGVSIFQTYKNARVAQLVEHSTDTRKVLGSTPSARTKNSGKWYNSGMTPKTTAKDFFLHLGAVVALYTSVIALINLIFSVINYLLPDQLAGYFSSNSIAWPISLLIVFVPLLYVLEGMIKKDIALDPAKKDIWVRRWRIYLTLFLTGLAIAISVVTLINMYLNGEIGWRFVWKVISIVVVAGAVFKYYFFDLNENHRFAKMGKAGSKWGGLVIVLAAIVMGFVVVGTPGKQRALRFDGQRVSDLQSIQWQIVSNWQQKQKLPATLADLKDSISGNIIPNDPETKKPYEYVVKGPTSFDLCANFGLKNEDTSGRGAYYGGRGYDTVMSYPSYGGDPANENWKHEAGRICFTRTIDPQKYPPVKPYPVEAL
jgi:hypothetical protein